MIVIRYMSSIAFVFAALFLAVLPSLAVAQTNLVTTEDPSVTRRALEWFERAQNGDIDQSQIAAGVAAKFTPQVTASLKNQLTPLGKPLGIAFGGARPEAGSMVYRYVLAFAVGSIQEYVSFDPNGKLSGLVFAKNS